MKNQTAETAKFKKWLSAEVKIQNSVDLCKVFDSQIVQSVDFLNSDAAIASLQTDPYWPKWNSPWWHMTLLFEMGLTHRIPARAINAFEEVLQKHYIKVFPLREEEIPAGKDPSRHIMCLCALGTALQILEDYGRNTDNAVPWAFDWFSRYQIDDGGYNCAEEVYLREKPRASIVSTVPMLEALLKIRQRRIAAGFGSQELDISLDAGASYVLNRRLLRSISKNSAVIDPDFLLLTFPRFYEYDILRGLKLVTSWAVARQQEIPIVAIEESMEILSLKVEGKPLVIERQFYAGKRTLALGDEGQWTRGHAVSLFDLLEAVGKLGTPSPFLQNSYAQVLENLKKLEDANLIEF